MVYMIYGMYHHQVLFVFYSYLEKYDSKGFLKSEDFEISKKKSKAVVSCQFFIIVQPRTIKTPNDFPAVSLPAAGSSYNPDKEQHQDLLGEQLAMELEFTEKIKKSKELPAGLTLSDLHNQSISPDILSVGCNNHN